MERRDLLGMLGIVTILKSRPASPPARQTVSGADDAVMVRFAGIYKLISYAPYGSNPAGRIYYERNGGMGAMLFPPGRKPLPENPTVDDYRAVQRGLVAYYGTYDVDESAGRLIHHIQAASNPAWVGTDFIRWYELSGKRLTLRTSQASTSPLVWERLA